MVEGMLSFHSVETPYPEPAWIGPDSDLRPYAIMRGLSPDERRERQRALRQQAIQEIRALRQWWLERMRSGPYPLQEKLTLFWHGHFATSAIKVRSPYAMYLQNETLRAHAAGSWRELIRAVARDPAMLVYLDNALSRPQRPNENFARELMELFTLGEGQYTEEDVRESARAFTGLTLEAERLAFVFRPNLHDDGPKTFLGHTGAFTADDIIDLILAHGEAAPFIARKLATYFMGQEPDPGLVQDLAAVLRHNDWDLAAMLRSLLLSPAFYDPAVIQAKIKSPVQWLVGTCRILERPLPPAALSERMLQDLGQELFAPPNVKGWDGGYSWISTTTLTLRNEYAAWLVDGRNASGLRPDIRRRFANESFDAVSPDRILPAPAPRNVTDTSSAFEQRFFHAPLRASDQKHLSALLDAWIDDSGKWSAEAVRAVSIACMQMPSFQLT